MSVSFQLFWGSGTRASRIFIFFKFHMRDQKSKAFMIPYVKTFPILKTNGQKYFKKSFSLKNKLNVSDPENRKLAPTAPVLEIGGEPST